jgi:hypothetical protein
MASVASVDSELTSAVQRRMTGAFRSPAPGQGTTIPSFPGARRDLGEARPFQPHRDHDIFYGVQARRLSQGQEAISLVVKGLAPSRMAAVGARVNGRARQPTREDWMGRAAQNLTKRPRALGTRVTLRGRRPRPARASRRFLATFSWGSTDHAEPRAGSGNMDFFARRARRDLQ